MRTLRVRGNQYENKKKKKVSTPALSQQLDQARKYALALRPQRQLDGRAGKRWLPRRPRRRKTRARRGRFIKQLRRVLNTCHLSLRDNLTHI